MRILIDREDDDYFYVAIETGAHRIITIDDEAHSNLGEVEAKARAAALHGATGWPIVKLYELD